MLTIVFPRVALGKQKIPYTRLENWAVFDEISGAQLLSNLRAGAKSLTQGQAQGLQGVQKRMLQCTCEMNIDI